MTWHAARFFLGEALLLILAAVAALVAWLVPHRGAEVGRGLTHRWVGGHIGPFAAFMERHFHSRRFSWVRAIAGAAIVAAALFWFVSILRQVLTNGQVVAADHRLHNTLRLFHSAALYRFYAAITNLGGTSFIVPLAISLTVLFWMHGRRYEAILFMVAIAGAEVLTVALKYVVMRPRPADAIGLVAGPSFPSGHTLAATSVYGILTFLLLREPQRRSWHVLGALVLISLIVLVPLSRVYLGVHWPHDVLASLSLGAAWLACLTLLVQYRPDRSASLSENPHALRRSHFTVFAILAVLYGLILARTERVREARPQLPPPRLVSLPLITSFPTSLGKTSEDLVGGPMEPLAFLFLGNTGDLRASFERAGWSLAETPSVSGLAKELFAVVRNAPDPHGPATPSYYLEQPQDFTFERAGDASGSIRHRHHIRIWREPICLAPGCTLVWGATCSYDRGIEFVAKPYLLTHQIDPRVDVEREFVATTLRDAGAQDRGLITVTGPRRGRNAGGDSFTTDGRAHVIQLAQTQPPRAVDEAVR